MTQAANLNAAPPVCLCFHPTMQPLEIADRLILALTGVAEQRGPAAEFAKHLAAQAKHILQTCECGHAAKGQGSTAEDAESAEKKANEECNGARFTVHGIEPSVEPFDGLFIMLERDVTPARLLKGLADGLSLFARKSAGATAFAAVDLAEYAKNMLSLNYPDGPRRVRMLVEGTPEEILDVQRYVASKNANSVPDGFRI